MFLPEGIIDHIFSFYHPYKAYYTSHVMIELKQRMYHQRIMKQLTQFTTYDRHSNLIQFEKYSILNSHSEMDT
jgi:hypothetical protein